VSRWFRLDDDIINDPKILLLPEAMRWIWVAFLCIASKNAGRLPSIEIIALSLRVKTTRAAEYLTRLVTAGLIDKTETGFAPHNWNARQFKSDVSTERVKRFRQQERNVSETPPHTQTETQAQTEKNQTRASALDDDWPKDFGDLFWQAYPRKTEKLSAMKKLATIRKSGIVAWKDLMAGVSHYAAAVSSKDPQYTKHPTTWLNAGCWADETQPGGSNGNGSFASKNRSSHDSFFAGIASVAADIVGDDPASGDADQEIPRGRVNIDG